MDAVISSLDKDYKLCDTRITDSEIILYIASTQEQLCCPYCGTMTGRVHSYHTREIQDLPISDRKTILIVTTRKMKCMNPECSHGTFAERHPFVNPNAQKTNRLIERILKTSSEMSSVCSSRLLKSENITIGKSSICTLLKKTPLIADKSKVYRVCIDDFALKKRYSYGTVMVDWDTHRIIDMIPSRESIEVSVWLSTYPNITMISRDGASGYASAGAKAHPDAVQVTDRFHLLKNLAEVVERYIKNKFPSRVGIESHTFYLTDDAANEYYYSYDSFGSNLGMNMSGAAEDDVLDFAVYKESAIIPIAFKNDSETEIGDVNDDGTFNSEDIKLLHNWLLSVPDTDLANWQAADFRDDDVLDACDLSLMKRQLISEKAQASFTLQSVTDIQTNVDSHSEWQGYVAHSENELIEILRESEGVSLEESALDGINQEFFSDQSIVILYSTYSPSNQYTIIENLSMRDNTINAATVTKMPSIPRIDMLYRRYVFRVNKDDVRELTGFSFSDTDSVYSELEETIVIRWFKEWSQS